MRLIDANALIKKQRIKDLSICLEDVIGAPTIDAVPVVRCKDCIHYGEVGDCEVHPHDGRFNVNYFCADGEMM